MPTEGDAKPYSKADSLKRGEKRHHRQVAGPKRWREIVAAKQGPCRCCLAPPPNQLHHLIARSQGGSDCESNLVPLCLRCHALIEARDPAAGMKLARSLTDAEHAYCVTHYGEEFFSRRLNVRYDRT